MVADLNLLPFESEIFYFILFIFILFNLVMFFTKTYIQGYDLFVW